MEATVRWNIVFLADRKQLIKSKEVRQRVLNKQTHELKIGQKNENDCVSSAIRCLNSSGINFFCQHNHSELNESRIPPCGRTTRITRVTLIFTLHIILLDLKWCIMCCSSSLMFRHSCSIWKRVLTGDYTKEAGGMIVPPAKNANCDPYDTVVDNPNAPTIFVVFRDDNAYPDYLITFT